VPTGPERASLVPPDYRAAYLNNPPPAYPRSARRNGEQGTVTLRVYVNADGVPAAIELDRSSGSSALDAAALESVKSWRFVPARRGTDPVAAWVIVPVVFRLAPAP
jgi:protein TonB